MPENMLKKYNEEISKRTTCPIADLDNMEDGSQVLLCGIIDPIKILTTRKGEKMARGDLRDSSGSIEVILFPDCYQQFEALTIQMPVFLKCKLQDEPLKGLVEDVSAFSEYVQCEDKLL